MGADLFFSHFTAIVSVEARRLTSLLLVDDPGVRATLRIVLGVADSRRALKVIIAFGVDGMVDEDVSARFNFRFPI